MNSVHKIKIENTVSCKKMKNPHSQIDMRIGVVVNASKRSDRVSMKEKKSTLKNRKIKMRTQIFTKPSPTRK